jgi:hypothetical protein
MIDTSANFPAGDPLDPQGRLTPQWRMFFLALFNRSGGAGNPVDLSTLQDAIAQQGKTMNDLFMLEGANASVALVGALVQRVAALEMALQSVVHVSRAADAHLPDAVPVFRQTQPLPDAVPVRGADSAADLYKLVNS